MDFLLLLVWLGGLGKGIVCLCFLVGIIWFKIWKRLDERDFDKLL